MTQIILRALNFPGLLLCAMLGIGIQTSLFTLFPLNYLQPDIILLLVLWAALRRPFFEGGLLTLLIADIAEIHSAVPRGVFLLTYMLVYLLIRAAAKLLVIPDLAAYVVVTIFASVFVKLGNLTILYMLDPHLSPWANTLFLLFPGAAVEGALAIWLFRWLEKYDSLTFKDRRAQESLEQELHLQEDEGF